MVPLFVGHTSAGAVLRRVQSRRVAERASLGPVMRKRAGPPSLARVSRSFCAKIEDCMAVATNASGRNLSPQGGPNSTLWTLVLGAALVRLVTAKRHAPFAEVMVGRRRASAR